MIIIECLLIFPLNKSYLSTVASFLPNLVLVSQPSVTLPSCISIPFCYTYLWFSTPGSWTLLPTQEKNTDVILDVWFTSPGYTVVRIQNQKCKEFPASKIVFPSVVRYQSYWLPFVPVNSLNSHSQADMLKYRISSFTCAWTSTTASDVHGKCLVLRLLKNRPLRLGLIKDFMVK